MKPDCFALCQKQKLRETATESAETIWSISQTENPLVKFSAICDTQMDSTPASCVVCRGVDTRARRECVVMPLQFYNKRIQLQMSNAHRDRITIKPPLAMDHCLGLMR